MSRQVAGSVTNLDSRVRLLARMRQRWQALSINRKSHRAEGYRNGNVRIYYVGTYIVLSLLRPARG